jgi:peroxiredoxin
VGIEDFTPIYFQQVENNDLVSKDTAKLMDSKVTFTGSLDQPEMIYLRVGDSRKLINIFAENADISVRVQIDSLQDARVTGSRTHDELIEFKEYLKPLEDKVNQLRMEYREVVQQGNTERRAEIDAEYEQLRQEQGQQIKDFVVSKPGSHLSPFIIRSYLVFDMNYSELNEMLTSLDSAIYSSKDYQVLRKRADILESVAVGKPAVDFALNDTTGNPISISSFKGKYLLIDFWASWCTPCRVENPNVVKLYNDYKDKGFEIIGVSFDEKRENWINAIHKDNLTWPHVSDLKGWSSAAGKLYGINSIPATVLIDPEGTIVAKNLRGDALRQKLEELIAQEQLNS